MSHKSKNRSVDLHTLYPERWKILGAQAARRTDAMYEYRLQHPGSSHIDAHRAVADFFREHHRRYG